MTQQSYKFDAKWHSVAALIQFRQDLEFLPADRRGGPVTRTLLDQARTILLGLHEAFQLPQQHWERLFPDNLGLGSSILDVYVHTGTWLNTARTLAPDLFLQGDQTAPFGFAAHPRVSGT